jgi:hypothetical protein
MKAHRDPHGPAFIQTIVLDPDPIGSGSFCQVGSESGSGIVVRDPDPPTASHLLAHYNIQPTLLSF